MPIPTTKRIDELKQWLFETDYIAEKLTNVGSVERQAMRGEYAEVLAQGGEKLLSGADSSSIQTHAV